MSDQIINTVDFQYKFQLRGAILAVAFQLFALSFLYLMSWNYELVKTSLTPMFWAVLMAVALHGPKSSMVKYLCKYDKRLAEAITDKVNYVKQNSSLFWWVPTFIITIIYRVLYFWKPIFFDVQYHARRYSKSNLFIGLSPQQMEDMDLSAPINSETETDVPSPSKSISLDRNLINAAKSSSSFTSFAYNATSDDADDESASDVSDLSVDKNNENTPNKPSKPQKSLLDSVGKMRSSLSMIEKKTGKVVVGGGKKVWNVAVWLKSPTGLFCSLFVALCAILLKSDVVAQLGLYTMLSNLFIFMSIGMVISAIFVLIPAWSKSTYNTFVVIFLILTLIGVSTLISGVLLFKIADETTRFVSLMNQVVDNSEVFKQLNLDLYLNATLEHLQLHLGPEMDRETFQKILANDHMNWTDAISTLFGGDVNDTTLNGNGNGTVTIEVISDEEMSNATDVSIGMNSTGEEDGGLMGELSKIFSGDIDVIRILKKSAKAIFGEHEWVNAVINLDFHKYIQKAQEWGLDLPFMQQILMYTKDFTTIIAANLSSIIGLLLSFGSWMISLGLDFMVFLACLFYLLVGSDEVFSTIKKIASIIPSDGYVDTPLLSGLSAFDSGDFSDYLRNKDSKKDRLRKDSEYNPHFLHSLFKSIQDIFVVTFEIFLCHAFVTWLTFTIFDVDFSFATAFTSGVFSIIPYFPPWIVCLHGVIYLIYQHKFINSLIMLGMHIMLLWIDPILMERIENSHPYLIGMSIVLGLTQFGLNGAIIGPLLVCFTSWSLKVIAFYCKHFATFNIDKRSTETNTPNKQKHSKQATIDDDDLIKSKLIFE